MDWLVDPPGLLLFNFDVDSSQLKIEHRQYLHDKAVPRIRWGNSVAVVGIASRTGTKLHNFALSLRRAERTLEALKSEIREGFNARAVQGIGEMKAEAEGYRDNTEDPRFRSVVLLFAPGPTPPFPPGLIKLKPPKVAESSIPEGFEWDYSKINDIASGVSGILELLPWEKLAKLGEFGDIYTALYSGIFGMYDLFHDLKEQNENNGRLEGFWDAFQDMANRYSNPKLSNIPLKAWPELVRPQPHSFPMPDGSVNQREWMDGKREACELVYAMMEEMDRDPKVVNDWHITGKRYLFMLSQQMGGNIAARIHAETDARIMGKGNPYGWPLRK